MSLKRGNKALNFLKSLLLYFLIFCFMSFQSVSVFFFNNLKYFFEVALILIFYFLIIKAEKEEKNLINIFILGLINDIFITFPLGFSSIIFLVSAKCITKIRYFLVTKDTYLYLLRDYVLFKFTYVIIKYLLLVLVYQNFYRISTSFIEFFISFITFNIMYIPIKKYENYIL